MPLKFENRVPTEGINARPDRLLHEAVWLVMAVAVAVIVLVATIDAAARWWAPRLPFSVELALAQRLEAGAAPLPADQVAANAALQSLADRLRDPLGLPADITVRVRVDPSPVVNAYAAVGGRITVYRGLLARLDREDELVALLAHEMTHVQRRHVAASMGRGLALGLALTALSSDAGGRVASGILNQGANLLALGYSREQERGADAGSLRAAQALYGHLGGTMGLFRRLGAQTCPPAGNTPSQSWGTAAPEWLGSHPLDGHRVAAVTTWAQANSVPLTGPSAPLPSAVTAFLASSALPGQVPPSTPTSCQNPHPTSP